MPELYVAFYRGSGRFADWLVRAVTRSAFSHVELIRAERRPRLGDTVTCLGSSGRDGGVRLKEIRLHPERWRIYDVCWAPEGTWERAMAEVGRPYELWALVTTQFLNLRRSRRGAWFCSELVAHALRLDMPHAYSPGDLLRAIRDHTDTWDDARDAKRPGAAERLADEPDGLPS